MDLGLTDKIVFITASTSGIGYAIAESFLCENARVIISARNKNKLNKALTELRMKYSSDKVFGICVDATKHEDLRRAEVFIQHEFGHVDVVIGNLGSGRTEIQNRYDVREWEELAEINLFSAVQLIDVFSSSFPIEGGCFLFLSSIAGINRIGAPVAYAAAKAGINTLVTYGAEEFAKKKIRINAVAPGNVFFKGGRWEELRNKGRREVDNYINSQVPLKRFATPREISDVVVFLCSNKTSFVTGTTVIVDGGQNKSIC